MKEFQMTVSSRMSTCDVMFHRTPVTETLRRDAWPPPSGKMKTASEPSKFVRLSSSENDAEDIPSQSFHPAHYM